MLINLFRGVQYSLEFFLFSTISLPLEMIACCLISTSLVHFFRTFSVSEIPHLIFFRFFVTFSAKFNNLRLCLVLPVLLLVCSVIVTINEWDAFPFSSYSTLNRNKYQRTRTYSASLLVVRGKGVKQTEKWGWKWNTDWGWGCLGC